MVAVVSTRLRIEYEAHGASPVGVLADAHRIAAEAFPGADVYVTVGPIAPELLTTDGSGHTQVNRWHADCYATADAELPGSGP